jgi:DNA polymerase III sliding clamp (beta) subunit (PCNA family)
MDIILKPEVAKTLLKIPTTGKSIIPATTLIKITAVEDKKYVNELDIEANGYLLIEKTNIDYSIKMKVPARINYISAEKEIAEKEIVLPEKIRQLLSSLVSLQEDIEMTVDENNCQLKAKKTKYKIPKMDLDLFIPIEEPSEDSITEIKLNGSLLKELIKKVFHSAGKKNDDFSIIELNISPSELKTAATNSYVLSIAKTENSHETLKVKEFPANINIPVEAVSLIEKIIPSEDIIIKDYESKIIIIDELENIEIHIAKTEKRLPNYSKIIESLGARENETQIIINKKEFEDLIKRALVIVEDTKKIYIKIDPNENKLTISASELESKFTEDLTSCQIESSEIIEIAINGTFLLNALSQIDTQEAKLVIYDNNSPVVVKGVNEPENAIKQTELIAPMS